MSDWVSVLSIVLNALFGGGLLLTLLTLRAYRSKASAESKSAELAADQTALQQFQEYVVNPLKKEVSSLRSEVRRFRKALDRIQDCEFKERCPVNEHLKKEADDEALD